MHKDLVVPFVDIFRDHSRGIEVLHRLNTTEHILAGVLMGVMSDGRADIDRPHMETVRNDYFLNDLMEYCFETQIFRGSFHDSDRDHLYPLIVQMYDRLREYVRVACEPLKNEFVSGWGIKNWVGSSPVIFIEYSSFGYTYSGKGHHASALE